MRSEASRYDVFFFFLRLTHRQLVKIMYVYIEGSSSSVIQSNTYLSGVYTRCWRYNSEEDRYGFCPHEASRLMEKAVTIDSKRNFNKGDSIFFFQLFLGIAQSLLLVREWRHRKIR